MMGQVGQLPGLTGAPAFERLAENEWPHGAHSRHLRAAGIHWHVQIMGEGPTLLLVHGTGASSHSFRELMPLLATQFTVVTPDLPGHAQSRAPAGFAYSPTSMSRALGGLLDALRLQPTVAVGHSAGAALIARMTLDHVLEPDLLIGLGAALTPLQGVAGALFPPAARLLSLASRVVDLRVSDVDRVERMLRSTGSSIDRGGVEMYHRLAERPAHVAAVLAMMAGWDLEPLHADLPRLRVPFLLLAGQNDRAVPLSQLRRVALRCPRARVVVVPRAGHLLHEERPAAIADLIRDEISSLETHDTATRRQEAETCDPTKEGPGP